MGGASRGHALTVSQIMAAATSEVIAGSIGLHPAWKEKIQSRQQPMTIAEISGIAAAFAEEACNVKGPGEAGNGTRENHGEVVGDVSTTCEMHSREANAGNPLFCRGTPEKALHQPQGPPVSLGCELHRACLPVTAGGGKGDIARNWEVYVSLPSSSGERTVLKPADEQQSRELPCPNGPQTELGPAIEKARGECNSIMGREDD